MKWRLIDTKTRTAAENIALDSVLLEARSKGHILNTLRFLQFSPPAALIGYHQVVEQEIRTKFCREKGIDINRRITGGGSIYFDESQLGWELIGLRSDIGSCIDDITRRVCEGTICGLKKLGINANFRPRNDIEIHGRKISGTGGTFEGEAFLYQGTLLIDFDVESMIKSLRIPTEKLTEKGLNSAKERVTCLKTELGEVPGLNEVKCRLKEGFEEAFGVSFENSNLSDVELKLFNERVNEFKSDDWIYNIREPAYYNQTLRSSYKAKGGLIRISARVDTKRKCLKDILITGDFFVNPQRTIFDLEAYLRNTPLESVKETIDKFFEEKKPELLYLNEEDFYKAIYSALEKIDYKQFGISLRDANFIFTVNGSLKSVLQNCSVLLLPYCAKLPECKYRNKDGCDKCGKCTIGIAYELAESRGLIPISIHNYEHLKETLYKCKQNGVKSYIGCCCEAFFVKRQNEFREVGLPGALIDIKNTTCYELQKELEALAGKFENQTKLRLSLLQKMIAHIPQRRAEISV